MGGGLESRCVGRVCGADGAVRLAPEKFRAANTSIKSPCLFKLAFQIISCRRFTVKQPSSYANNILATSLSSFIPFQGRKTRHKIQHTASLQFLLTQIIYPPHNEQALRHLFTDRAVHGAMDPVRQHRPRQHRRVGSTAPQQVAKIEDEFLHHAPSTGR